MSLQSGHGIGWHNNRYNNITIVITREKKYFQWWNILLMKCTFFLTCHQNGTITTIQLLRVMLQCNCSKTGHIDFIYLGQSLLVIISTLLIVNVKLLQSLIWTVSNVSKALRTNVGASEPSGANNQYVSYIIIGKELQ